MWRISYFGCSQPGEGSETNSYHDHPGAEVKLEAGGDGHEAAQQLGDEDNKHTAASIEREGDGQQGGHSEVKLINEGCSAD